jgi:hypothetical protein
MIDRIGVLNTEVISLTLIEAASQPAPIIIQRFTGEQSAVLDVSNIGPDGLDRLVVKFEFGM